MAELQREAITARIKQARKESGLTQDEMADVLDVARRTYWNYEDSREGEGRVPWGLLGRIAEVTGKSTAWLIHGEETADAGAGAQGQLDRIEQHLETVLELLRVRAVVDGADMRSSAPKGPRSKSRRPPRGDARGR